MDGHSEFDIGAEMGRCLKTTDVQSSEILPVMAVYSDFYIHPLPVFSFPYPLKHSCHFINDYHLKNVTVVVLVACLFF